MTTEYHVDVHAPSSSPSVKSAPATIAIDPIHPDGRLLLRAAVMIRRGAVVAHPTETFYGLATDPFNREAIERLFEMKGRPSVRSVILLIAYAGQVFDLATAPGASKIWLDRLARVFWPGPLTLVLPARKALSCPALSGADTVAMRVPSHPVAWQLARTTGQPITSTSANLTGMPPATAVDRIDPALSRHLDLTLDGGATAGGAASTLLDLTGTRPRILRAGRISAEAIATTLGVRPVPA